MRPIASRPEVVARVEIGDQRLQRRRRRPARRRNRLQHRVEQRPQVLARLVEVGRRRAQPGVRVEDGEVELILGRVEVDEEVEDLVHARPASARPTGRSC